MPERFQNAETCAQQVIERLDGRVSIALPLGLGKAMLVTNALYQQAQRNPHIELTIHTALSLEVPRARSALEARFLEPLVARLYNGVPQLDYLTDLHRGKLPPNVSVEEFYFRPGAFLGVPESQQNYLSVNYTGASMALLDRGINAAGQMVAPGRAHGTVSLSCNPDITLDLLDRAKSRNQPLLMIGEINPQLPFMPNDAVLPESEFDILLDSHDNGYPLFPVPNRAASIADHAIALRIAALVKDNGTLQIGIGSLGDAIANAIGIRHTDNAAFLTLLNALAPHAIPVEEDTLPQGLYASTEMFVEGLLHLHELGVLRRTVEDEIYLHAGFYLGSKNFYERLRRLDEETLQGINMTRISFTNSLYRDDAKKTEQRRNARFVNSAMMVTLNGAVVSDGLADGEVVSGVGGQFNFVAMAQELPGARSIIALPATRTARGVTESNIVWNYPHTTIPRHLRDIVVTEYGVADLRNAADHEIISRLLNVTDSSFQEALRERAVAAGKLPASYQIPAAHRHNTAANLHDALKATGEMHALPTYPLGTDLTDVEAALAVALPMLAAQQGNPRALLKLALRGRRQVANKQIQPGLERMALLKPHGIKAHFYQALVAGALHAVLTSGRTLLPDGR